MLTVGSLFSGIGGLDPGLERAGMHVKWQSEIDLYACKVLAKHWPNIPNHGDIKQIDWRTVEPVDVICGGYPCQPFSTAGKRRGTDDPRHLWPWVRDAISALRPRYAILENVRGHLSMGGTTVIGELAKIGYDAEWRIVSAAGLGAPHRRDRIIIVAYPNGRRSQVPLEGKQSSEQLFGGNGTQWKFGIVADTEIKQRNGRGFEQCGKSDGKRRALQNEIGASSSNVAYSASSSSRNTQSHDLCTIYGQTSKLRKQDCIRRPDDHWWETEPDVGQVADGVSARVDRLRGLGNAVVPQVAEYIGRLVMAAEYDA